MRRKTGYTAAILGLALTVTIAAGGCGKKRITNILSGPLESRLLSRAIMTMPWKPLIRPSNYPKD